MKIAKLVSGILSICFSVLVLFQSCAAGFVNSIQANGESGGSGGLFVSILMLAGGIVMLSTRKSEKKGGSVAALILYLLGALLGFSTAGSFADLNIWAGFCLIIALLNVFSMLGAKKKTTEGK